MKGPEDSPRHSSFLRRIQYFRSDLWDLGATDLSSWMVATIFYDFL